MGFKKPLESMDVKAQLFKTHGEICSAYNDGYIQWGLKKELYDIKWLLDEMLKRQPTLALNLNLNGDLTLRIFSTSLTKTLYDLLKILSMLLL